jgi:type IX secretion system PorP/SprF family membrane protein
MKRIWIFCLFMLGLSEISHGQDVQFSQFYASPLYLNPGFAGSSYQHRFNANYRIQWPSLPEVFNAYSFSYDYNMPKLNSGLGVLLVGENAGSLDLNTTNVGLIYSYKARIGDQWVISPGLQFSYTFRNLASLDKIRGFEQLDFNNPNVPSSDPAFANISSTNYIDLGAGLLAYNRNAWIGFSAFHINQPNNSLAGNPIRQEVKYTVHGGYRLFLYQGPRNDKNLSSIAPAFIYRKQGEFDQLDFGLHFNYNPLVAGLWYRGIPLQQEPNGGNSNDAIVLVLGLRFEQFDVGYSYDFTISELGADSGGAHEISLMYQFNIENNNKVTRKEKFVPCPTF